MSHFTAERFGLAANQENLQGITDILHQVADSKQDLHVINDEVIENRYNLKARVIVGLQSSNGTINPMGFQVTNGEFVLQVDHDYSHHNSVTKQRTEDIFTDLQARLIQLRKDDAIRRSQTEFDRLRQNGVNVSVKVH